MKVLEHFLEILKKKTFRPRKISENFCGENAYVVFSMSYKLEFILFIKIQKEKNLKEQNFRKENKFSQM